MHNRGANSRRTRSWAGQPIRAHKQRTIVAARNGDEPEKGCERAIQWYCRLAKGQGLATPLEQFFPGKNGFAVMLFDKTNRMGYGVVHEHLDEVALHPS